MSQLLWRNVGEEVLKGFFSFFRYSRDLSHEINSNLRLIRMEDRCLQTHRHTKEKEKKNLMKILILNELNICEQQE